MEFSVHGKRLSAGNIKDNKVFDAPEGAAAKIVSAFGGTYVNSISFEIIASTTDHDADLNPHLNTSSNKMEAPISFTNSTYSDSNHLDGWDICATDSVLEDLNLNSVPPNLAVSIFSPLGFSSLTELRSSKRAVMAVASMAFFVDYYLWCVVAPLLPQIIDERTDITGESEKAWAQGALFASFAAGALLAAPLVGIYSDRWGERYLPMMVGLAALSAASLSFIFARGIVWLVLARLLQGMSASVTEVMSLTIMGDSFEQDELGAAMGFVNAAGILGQIGGLISGSSLAEQYGLDVPFYFCAGLVGIDLISRLLVIPAPPRRMGKEEIKDASLIKLFCNQEILATLAIGVVLPILLYTGLDAAIPLLMETNLGMTATMTSYVMIAVMVPQVLLSPSIGRLSDTMSKRKLIVGGLILLGIGYPMIPIFAAFADQQRLVWLIVSASITGINFTIVRNPVSTRLSDLVGTIGSSSYGRVCALYSMCTNFGILLGPVILDGLMTSIGSIPAWCIFGAISILLAPLFIFLTKPDEAGALEDACDEVVVLESMER